MMSNNYSKISELKKDLTKIAKSFQKEHRKKVIDIVLYGSAVRGKAMPRDIDIAIILKDVSKTECFNLAYELRKQIEIADIKADVKGMLLEDLFDSKFLARPSILIEGFSLLKSHPLSSALGFTSYSLFVYSLRNMTHNQKTKFQYALNGRRKSLGTIQKIAATHIAAGAVLVPIEKTEEFKDFLISWNINFDQWKGLLIKTL